MMAPLIQANAMRWQIVFIAILLTGCASLEKPGKQSNLIARNSEFIVVLAGQNDTFQSLAERYLGDPSKEWIISSFNKTDSLSKGEEVVIPLKPVNPAGVFPAGYITVPILTYHQFGPGETSRHRLEVSEQLFRQQMAYLQEHGYHVIQLTELAGFLEGQRALPPKSVILTIDDGYRSIYTVAYPILQEFGYSATVFLYSGFVGAPDALTREQMKELNDSDLIDIQAHSKLHSNLSIKDEAEDEAAYEDRLDKELSAPKQYIEQHLGQRVYAFGYPFGDTTDLVITKLKAKGYSMGLTVQRGGNPSFADPYMLRRTMIYGDDDLATFANHLKVFETLDLQ